ncbi:MAG: hypothetical protein LKJ47_08900 [Bifidobacteriaceae bacterium]|jgi:hypothetical protein|nr:hypothetical protein [Bifidobacteriaceae bacterium]
MAATDAAESRSTRWEERDTLEPDAIDSDETGVKDTVDTVDVAPADKDDMRLAFAVATIAPAPTIAVRPRTATSLTGDKRLSATVEMPLPVWRGIAWAERADREVRSTGSIGHE